MLLLLLLLPRRKRRRKRRKRRVCAELLLLPLGCILVANLRVKRRRKKIPLTIPHLKQC
jgi:hypothetical protein